MSKASLTTALEALKKDLLAGEGPRITTIRNYRFAIVPYAPEDEFELRRMVKTLSDDLRSRGWNVLEISLHKLLMKRLKEQDQEFLDRLIATEKRQYERNPERAFRRVKDRVANLVEGREGIAQDIIRIIDDFAEKHPDAVDKTLIWIKRMGALYPFSRTSTLLKFLDGQTRQFPVVLLYPGKREDKTALSFMSELTPDRDYRPRIYP